MLSPGRFLAPRRARILLAVLSLALLAACGGGDDSNDFTAYLADGRAHAFTLDVEGKQAKFQDVADGTLAFTGTAPVFTFGRQSGAGATARFVVPEADLVVGNAPLQDRTTLFVAGRNFLRSAAEAAGEYNVFGLTSPAAGDYRSAPAAWRIETGGNLLVCAAVRPIRVAACPVESLTRFTLRVEGDEFIASSPTVLAPLRFRIAVAGGDRILLQGGTSRFAIGLPDGTAPFRSGRSQGPSTDGAWSVVDHSALNYSSEGVAAAGGASNFVGTLSAGPAADTPAGVRHFDGGSAYVMQSRRLTVLLGRPATQADGFLQIGVAP